MPPSLNLAAARADLDTLDKLRPLLDRVARLVERGRDTEMALGSDAMVAALDGYKLLEVLGRHEGLQGLKKELGERWAKSPRRKDSEEGANGAGGEGPEPGAE